ncbi:AraC family transcriptional regulator [Taklimakanibacter deserti]|uniref:AraC family transcriptional regulator n=1 Tax=Taklimakanibacter deserti TaxID=2267839 RepID=UPI0013C4DD50
MDDFELGTRLVTIHAQPYADGEHTGWHRHVRGQILTASEGLMVATTELGAWYVPTGHALWIPPGLEHDVAMRGAVTMRSAYVESAAAASLPSSCKVIVTSALLAAAIEALALESARYAEHDRGGHLAALIVDEVAHAADASLALPMPRDARLVRLCNAILARGERRGLDGWAEHIGMSRRSLTRHFRAETGLSLLAWRKRAAELASLS